MRKFTVRVVRQTDVQKEAMSRDHTGFTKNEALRFIRTLGKLSSIQRMGKMYIAVVSTRKG